MNLLRYGALLVLVLCGAVQAESPSPTIAFNIESQQMPEALNQFAHQSGYQLLFQSEVTQDVMAPRLVGAYSPEEALKQLLANSGLSYRFINDRTITIRAAARPAARVSSDETHSTEAPPVAESLRLAQAERAERPVERTNEAASQSTQNIPEILVKGSKILNMDIKRTRDDAQPYVVFDRETIERSGANNIDQFLKTRLPMNTVFQSPGQNGLNLDNGNNSRINLRGLGENQTLILIDGRRAPANSTTVGPGQPDLNGIPLMAVERIEILPTTASGIYGGSATGGVINVILRRDYAGAEVDLTYENTFDSDSTSRRIDVAGGTSFEDGKTNVLFSASYADANDLLMGERNFIERGRALVAQNNYAYLIANNGPPTSTSPNIRSGNGAALVLKPAYGGFNLNSPITHVPLGFTGSTADLAAALRNNAGSYNLAFADTAQGSILGGAGKRTALVTAPTVKSAMLTLRREFSDRIQAFVDVSASQSEGSWAVAPSLLNFSIPQAAAINPFNQAINVVAPIYSIDGEAASETTSRRLVTGVIFRLGAGWTAELDATLGRSSYFNSMPGANLNDARTAVSTGAINIFADPSVYSDQFQQYMVPPSSTGPFRSRLTNGAARFSGPLFRLPAGEVMLSGLVESQREKQQDSYSFNYQTNSGNYYPSRSQEMRSVYLETKFPLVSAAQNIPAIRSLEFQVAGRYDDYTVNGVTSSIVNGSTAPIDRVTNKLTSTNPTLGLRWLPTDDLIVRASYGTGFLPPSVGQLIPRGAISVTWTGVVDPRRGNEPLVQIPSTGGGNPNLKPEESESWSAGLVFTPRFAPGLRLSADYLRLSKTDNITGLNVRLLQIILDNEAQFPGRFTRGPVPVNDPYGVGPIIALDGRTINLAQQEIEAFDLAADYTREWAGVGTFEFFAVGTLQPHFKTRLEASLPLEEGAGIGGSGSSVPVKFKGNAGVGFTRGGWSLNWSTQYFDSYWVRDPALAASAATLLAQGNGGKVKSQIFHDFMAQYSFSPTDSRWLSLLGDELEVQVGIRNVLDKAPAFDAINQLGYYSYLADPRMRSYSLSVKSAW